MNTVRNAMNRDTTLTMYLPSIINVGTKNVQLMHKGERLRLFLFTEIIPLKG